MSSTLSTFASQNSPRLARANAGGRFQLATPRRASAGRARADPARSPPIVVWLLLLLLPPSSLISAKLAPNLRRRSMARPERSARWRVPLACNQLASQCKSCKPLSSRLRRARLEAAANSFHLARSLSKTRVRSRAGSGAAHFVASLRAALICAEANDKTSASWRTLLRPRASAKLCWGRKFRAGA